MACLEHGIPPATLPFHEAVVEHISNHLNENYGALEKMACHFAAEVFQAVGEKVSPEFCLFDQLRKVANWNPYYDQYARPVFNALCSEQLDARADDEQQAETIKRAFVANVLGMLGKGLTATPTIAKTVLAGGAAAGAGLGSLYWALNRHATEDDDKNEALKARIKLYRRIKSEIAEDLKRNSVVPSDSPRNIIAQDAGTTNII